MGPENLTESHWGADYVQGRAQQFKVVLGMMMNKDAPAPDGFRFISLLCDASLGGIKIRSGRNAYRASIPSELLHINHMFLSLAEPSDKWLPKITTRSGVNVTSASEAELEELALVTSSSLPVTSALESLGQDGLCPLLTQMHTDRFLLEVDSLLEMPAAEAGTTFFGNVDLAVTANGKDWNIFEGGFQYFQQPIVSDISPK